jgi:hypothetical protein
MRIPLVARKRFGEIMPFARICVKGYPLRLLALVDTGSPWTAITPMGKIMLKIRNPPKTSPPEYQLVYFAGHEFRRILMGNLQICMKSERERIVTFNSPQVNLLEPTKQMDPNEFKEIPFIIGSDFLTFNNLSLYFKPSSRVAFLEME